jgi:hypothetical protein
MSNFDDDDDGDFFSDGSPPPEIEQRLGLVVPPKARVICHPVTGELIWDELVEMEFADRMRGREIITFEEDESTKPPIMRDY